MNRKTNSLSEQTSNTSFFLALPAFVWLILFLYIPLLFMFFLSVARDGLVKIWPNITFSYYTHFFNPTYYTIILRSLTLSLVTSVFCFLFAYPIAYFLARRARKWKNPLLFLLALPFGVNFVILAYSWFFILEKTGLINMFLHKLGLISQPIQLLNTNFAIYAVMIYCYLPFMVLPVYAILEKLDVRLLDASYDLGASKATTFWQITLPQSMPGIQTGFFIVFIPTFGEYIIPSLMGGGKFMYVGSLIAHYFGTFRNLHLGAAFTYLSSTVLLFFALFFYWRFRKSSQ